MQTEGPSRTALHAAAARAAHLIVDGEPVVFRDPFAYPLLGECAEQYVGLHREAAGHPVLAALRAAVVTRSRYTEDRLAAAVRQGVRQYVILGAGLDTYACRSAASGRDGPVKVFEVDHPDTQCWKREALARAGIPVPPLLTYVPADMEAGECPVDRLVAHGLDLARPAFASWLGVTVYLTREAVARTLAGLGRLAPGSEIVMDHLLPEALRGPRARAYAETLMPLVAEGGEPWLTFLSPREAADLLEEHGFEVVEQVVEQVIEQVAERDAAGAALRERTDALAGSGISVITHARRRA
ncbi:class I SAM-dependent methyltransferase [Microbispora hainanensis]|uniref:class I SAM-dependent methyltransferase n=1 Tax=Microbispora hainanensis TaxID=568844 RepID=UPI003410F5E9